jgi:hypothetical protein
MGKLLLFLGIVLGIAGTVGMVLGFTGQFSQLGQMITSAVQTPDAAEYCQPGEQIQESGGAASYSPDMGWGRTVIYYCVDAQGNRRDITSAVMDNLFGSMGGVLGSVFNGVGSLLLSGGLCSLGALLGIIGLVMVLARRRRTVDGQFAVPMGGAPAGGVGVDPLGQSEQTAEARLRKLEQLYAAGTISAEEYERLRRQILQSL